MQWLGELLPSVKANWWLLLAGALLLLERVPFVSGQTESPAAVESRDDFSTRPLVLLPGEFSQEARTNRYKLGHWAQANLRIQSNQADTTGELHAYLVDTYGESVPVRGTQLVADSTRPVSLPRGQEKNLEALVFLPQRDVEARAANVRVQLTSPAGLQSVDTVEPVLLLKPYQYHLVALVRNPDEFKYLRRLDCIQIPRLGADNAPPFFAVVYPSADQPIPLAPNALAWTTIAYIVWDQILPEELSEEQQRALVDWLHFGGQLIISGPNSIERLQGSLLEPYLPVRLGETRNLAEADFEGLNRFWSTPLPNNPDRRRDLNIPATAPMLGIELGLNPGAVYLPGAEQLAAEIPVGRGRIVVTAFPLSEKRLLTWPCFANFFNGALLRRPARTFVRTELEEPTFHWTEDGASIFDPLLGSAVRFAARDLPTSGVYLQRELPEVFPNDFANPAQAPQAAEDSEFSPEGPFEVNLGPRNRERNAWHYGGFEADPQGGVAAWNDEVGIAAAARDSISLAAGIHPPSAEFVLRLLGIYLLCLVPLNWLVFRLIGKVEWAWIAAPLIAIVGAIAVVKLAALDIGFVRSQSQIGLLEIPVEYERGHLTEYSALYTSLSTRYEVEFEDATGLALPFPPRSIGGVKVEQSLRPVYLERTMGNRLRDFLVQSNSTGMLHSENLVPLGGRIELVGRDSGEAVSAELKNGSTLDLEGAGVVERREDGSYRLAWLGDLPAGATRPLVFQELTETELYRRWKELDAYQSIDERCRAIWSRAFGSALAVPLERLLDLPEFGELSNELMQYYRRAYDGQPVTRETRISFLQFKIAYSRLVYAPQQRALGLGEIFDALTAGLALSPGECRLLAHSSAAIGRHRLRPEATRQTRSTLILAHLQPPPFPAINSDANHLLDLLNRSDLDWLREEESEAAGEESEAAGEEADQTAIGEDSSSGSEQE